MRTERPTYRPSQMMPFDDIANPYNAAENDMYAKDNNEVAAAVWEDALRARDEVLPGGQIFGMALNSCNIGRIQS